MTRRLDSTYPGDLASIRATGAELVPIDTLRDTAVPVIDGLFLGGGFPERHMQALAANRGLRCAIRAAVEGGLPVYAECGGLMYLSKQLRWGDRRADMVGVLPIDIVMQEQPRGRGYVRLRETVDAPWPHPHESNRSGGEVCAHEFHYSRVCNVQADLTFAYEVSRGYGVDGKHDGIVYSKYPRQLFPFARYQTNTAGPTGSWPTSSAVDWLGWLPDTHSLSHVQTHQSGGSRNTQQRP